MNIEELKRLALDSKAWYDAGAVITDPYDTYPCELFDAAVDATVVLELISQIERLTAEAELFAKHVGLKLARKDALLRVALATMRSVTVDCRNFHHTKKDQHDYAADCAPLTQWNVTVSSIETELWEKYDHPH